jgi:Tfp pilus assembly protein PilO
MRTGRVDRLWMIGGAVGALVLLAIGWFFFISPQKGQTISLNNRAAETQLRLTSLGHKLADLRQQNRDLPLYRAQLARDRRALPTTSDLSNFLRELQTAGDGTAVSVSGLLVGSPTEINVAATKVYALPITLNAEGTAADLDLFLDQLQRAQPRAVLITSANATPIDQSGSLAGAVSLTLSMQVFVASPGSAGKTPPTTTTK